MSCFDYIVVQAGGRGSRLEYLTDNKPKCLLPVDNRPMIFHLFEMFPDKKFIVIGDYKVDVLEKYLNIFANVNYKLVNASGSKGTCAGISNALKYIPNGESFLLIWSDLILSSDFVLPNAISNYIFLSGDFKCRWQFANGIFSEVPSACNGVSGFFAFINKSVIEDVPSEGEFVRYLATKNISFESIYLSKTKEYGLIDEYKKIKPCKCRPFNSIEQDGGLLIKKGITKQGEALSIRECNWYRKAKDYGFDQMPEIYNYSPLVMEKIIGNNFYDSKELSSSKKRELLNNLVCTIKTLHSYEKFEVSKESVYEAYVKKTMDRLIKVKELIPYAGNDFIEINGRKCINIFKHEDILDKYLPLLTPNYFCFIHGDCTFSNTMYSADGKVYLIDPRGYFGKTELYGDPKYDWAKIYYSLVGNYDRFNLKEFRLKIENESVTLNVDSNGWESLGEYFLDMIDVDANFIKLIHAIIWLSLTTYAWEDYDSICGAFYNGLYYLQDAIESIGDDYEQLF